MNKQFAVVKLYLNNKSYLVALTKYKQKKK